MLFRAGGFTSLLNKGEEISRSLVEEHDPEPSAGGPGGHQVHQGTDGRGHDRSHPRREHGREQRRQEPDSGLGPAPATLAALEPPEEVEEQRDGGVGAGYERDGARVVPRPVDGERRVARQRGEGERGQQAVAVEVHLLCLYGGVVGIEATMEWKFIKVHRILMLLVEQHS